MAARSLTGPRAAAAARGTGGRPDLLGHRAQPGMDITACRMAELPFSAARLRHEIERITADGRPAPRSACAPTTRSGC